MQTVAMIAMDGLVYASWLFLVSVGLTLIYGVLRILNIAHGSIYALGAYTAASLILRYFGSLASPYWSYTLLLGGAVVVGLVVGPIVERAILRRTYGRDSIIQLLVTYALFLILEDAIKLIWGVDPLYAFEPYALLPEISVAGIPYPGYDLLLIGVAVGAGLLLWLFVHRTRFGKLVLAVIEDREISEAVGIDVSRIYVLTFTLGAMLAALGGAFTAPLISVQPGLSVEVIVLAFAVVVTGGLGSLVGAALGALIVGVVRAGAVHLLPELELFVIYLIMAVILVMRPWGLFGRLEVRRI